MIETIIKITSGDNANLTYENDTYYTLNLLKSNYYLISPPEDFSGDREYVAKENFGDIEVYAKYIGRSRVDKSPLFTIDLKSLNRKNKIDQIIK